MRQRFVFLALLAATAASFAAAQVKPPDAPPFKPPTDIPRPKTPDEPPGTPEKTTGTVQSYEPEKSLVLTTPDGSRTFDLKNVKISGDTDFAVGDQITVVKTVDPRGQVTLTIAKEAAPGTE
ncbi:MAG TPA: hypothetical protein VKH46_01585 [Thermoanaerobaculia bacterium]|jgi:hypothetical protein|nr:hypothetical protein [Thermoanaerobaculia bacterium]